MKFIAGGMRVVVVVCSFALSGCVTFSNAPASVDEDGHYLVKVGDVVRAKLRAGDVIEGVVTAISTQEIAIDETSFPSNAIVSLEVREFSLGATTVNTILAGAGVAIGVVIYRYIRLREAFD